MESGGERQAKDECLKILSLI